MLKKKYAFLYPDCRIAISGLSGCGITTICKELSAVLEIPCINYTFRNLAVERNSALEKITALAEQNSEIDKFVDQKQKILANENPRCIVGSRLAIWLIENADIRIYLEATLKTRCQRIKVREEKTIAQVRRETEMRDKGNEERYKKLYAIDVLDYKSRADHIVDSNNLNQLRVVEKIISLLESEKLITWQRPRGSYP